MSFKWDIEKVKKFVEENSKCKLLSTEYKDYTSELKFRCKCGNEFKTSFKEFKGRKDKNNYKRQCNECGIKSRADKIRKPQKQFIKEVYELVGDKYTVLGKYVIALKKIKFKHNLCGYVFYMAPNDFLKGQRCPCCYGTPKKTTDEYKKDVKKIVGNEYEVLGEYENNKSKILMKHNKCGHIWETTPNRFLSGIFCPKCVVKSKGELRIRKHLEKCGINFKEQFIIGECRHINPLPFDFAIFKNNKLELLIEYDGEQHYKPTRFCNGKDKFKEVTRNDKIKRNYCKENNIELLEIPYTQFENIEKILDNILI